MDVQALKNQLLTLINDQSLLATPHLEARKEALDLIAYVGEIVKIPGNHSDLQDVYYQSLALCEQLRTIDQQLFQRVRADLIAGNFGPDSLRTLLNQFTAYTPDQRGQPDFEYNGLDVLLEQAIFPAPFPTQSREREPGMIRYEATPARIILELIDSLTLTPHDYFVDLGSGLGLVVILFHLLTGLPATGIEFDPVYCEYAQSRAAELNLKKVTFLNADARSADLSQGTIFYFFTPFINEVFNTVLEKLRQQAKRRSLYICSYGTCTLELAKLPWLQIRDPAMEHDFKLAIFTSL